MFACRRVPLAGVLGLAAAVLFVPALWAQPGPAKEADDKKAEKKADEKKTSPRTSSDKQKAAELEKARAEEKQAREELRKLHEQARGPMEKLFKARRQIAELEGRHVHGRCGHGAWGGRFARGRREAWGGPRGGWRGPWGGPRFGWGGWPARGPWRERQAGPAASSTSAAPRSAERSQDLDKKLDAILKDLNDLKRELKK